MTRRAAVTLAAVLAAAVVTAAAAVQAADTAGRRVVGYGQIRYMGAGPERWAARYRQEHRRVVDLQRLVIRRLTGQTLGPRAAIELVFGPDARDALAVSACETGGTFSTHARNGQYLGLFQMGRWERGRYGDATSPFRQALAAYVYFVDTGRTWAPWSCRP